MNMKRMHETTSLNNIIGGLRFLIIRLKPLRRDENIVLNIQEMVDNLVSKSNEFDMKKLERVGQTAQINYLDDLLDSTVIELSRVILNKSSGRRDSSLYKTMFPITPSKVLSGIGTTTQEAYIKNIINLIESNEEYNEFEAIKNRIKSSLDELNAAMAQRETFYLDENNSHNELRILRLRATRMYNLSYHQLSLLYADDQDFVDSLFYKF
jgi:hypothetical protein